MEMNSIPWSPVLWYATPLPMNRTSVSTVALQHKSVSSVLRYATPLPMNRTPVSTVALQHKSISSVLRYATPLPDEQNPRFDRTAPTQVRFVHFAVRHTPPDQQDPLFDRRRSVSSILRYATPLPINRTPFSTVGGLFCPFCSTPHPSRSTGPLFRP